MPPDANAAKDPALTPVKQTLLGSGQGEIASDVPGGDAAFHRDGAQLAQAEPSAGQSRSSAGTGDASNYYLKFDGRYLRLYDGDNVIKEWPAVSGKENFGSPLDQDKRNYGPIPEGTYDIKQSRYQEIDNESLLHRFTRWPGGTHGWGTKRVWADPTPETVASGLTFGRTNMAIHGGDVPGSAGCIDLTNQMDDFAKNFRALGRDLKVHCVVDTTHPKDCKMDKRDRLAIVTERPNPDTKTPPCGGVKVVTCDRVCSTARRHGWVLL